ncbi:MAG: hypothetical protein CSA70_10985 [Rhodobacterales bacterium]|nr:MAG: hypothetical protein CSA70_10985 [Rhodobacterales bacterium]
MRSAAAILALFVAMPGGSHADGLPDPVALRLQQGITACLGYYARGTPLTSLQKQGFARVGTSGKAVEYTLQPAELRRPIKVRVFTEGQNQNECEIHANYTRRNAHRHAFNLLRATVADAGFRTIREQRFGSKGKTIFQRESLSLFMKTRERDNMLMLKFKLRSR